MTYVHIAADSDGFVKHSKCKVDLWSIQQVQKSLFNNDSTHRPNEPATLLHVA